MNDPDLELHRLLGALALDAELRERLHTEPDVVLGDYALREEDAQVLRRGGGLPLDWLGRAIDAYRRAHPAPRRPHPAARPRPHPPQQTAGTALPPVALTVQVVPQLDASGAVQYAASLQPAEVALPYTPPTASPWGHQLDGAAVEAAAVQVHEATPAERYEALLRLVSAMVDP